MADFMLWFLLFCSFLLAVFSLALATFGLSALLGAPFVSTPPEIASKMLEFADFQPGESIIDLGSGSGTILLVAVEEFGAEKAIGYEINPLLVWLSRFRAWWRGNRHVKTIRANFYSHQLEDVNIVATYLLPGTMNNLVNKFKDNFSAETRIISRGFEFSQAQPIKVSKERGATFYLYRVGDL